jgi:hypothetical protein
LCYEQLTKITKLTFTVLPHFYLRTSRALTPCASGSRKRKAGRSDSIRSIGIADKGDVPGGAGGPQPCAGRSVSVGDTASSREAEERHDGGEQDHS